MASFYVLLFHEVNNKFVVQTALTPAWKSACAWLNFGHFSVVVFIVLSGFSLMLPVARAGTMKLVGGFRRYIYRRARRIFPPYYVALLLSGGLIAAFNAFGSRFGFGQRVDDAALSSGSILSHVLLIHNLRFDWAYRINAPMWSVATEWHIYFVFAALLLPLCRRIGVAATAAAAWVLGSVPFFLLPPDSNFFWACPWLVGSFAFGMWGALLGFSPPPGARALRSRAHWDWITLAGFLVLALMVVLTDPSRWPLPELDFLVSVVAVAAINACVASWRQPEGARSPILRFLKAKPLVYLGGFSYSLYLVHYPILRLIEKGLGRLRLSADANAAAEILLGTPIVMAVAWIFSELFERPFTAGGVLIPRRKRPSNGDNPTTK